MSLFKILFLLVVFILFAFFPFFEGGETATGLFLFHSITLAALSVAALTFSRLCIPRFLKFFLPFGLVLLISTSLSDYKYAAFLKLWDYYTGALWAILICTLLHERKAWFESTWIWFFCIGVVSSILAISIYNPGRFGRISASFLNANEYATFALMLLCFGLFCLEQEIDRRKKILIGVLCGLLLISVGSSLSRGIFIACFAVAIITFLKHRSGKVIRLLLVLLVVVSGIFVALRYRSYDDPVKYYRWKIWKSSLRGIAEDPYLGIGLGQLEYRARIFNFPAESELGRYGRIAQSADSQFVEILAETGFFGFLSFLFGWGAIYFSLRKAPKRYFYIKLSWLIVSMVALFSAPLQNTTILFLFIFLIAICVTATEGQMVVWNLNRPGRILVPVACFLIFVLGDYLPFQAHQEFQRAVGAKTLVEADEHLAKAVRYNPYQPYYKFTFVRRIVDSKPQWETSRWLSLLSVVDQSIALNPFEFHFYVYKARIYRRILERQRTLQYYSSAVSSYQTALDHNPYNVFLRLEFASFLNQLQRSDLAEKELMKTLETEPAYLNARLFFTEVLIERGRQEEARKEFDKFQDYHARFRKAANYSPSPYVRSLLQVNRKQKERIEELLKAG